MRSWLARLFQCGPREAPETPFTDVVMRVIWGAPQRRLFAVDLHVELCRQAEPEEIDDALRYLCRQGLLRAEGSTPVAMCEDDAIYSFTSDGEAYMQLMAVLGSAR